jgi:hypothetical protein
MIMNQNSSEDQLQKLLIAAQGVEVPVPKPSAWFEQRMLAALREEPLVGFPVIEGKFIFRIMAGAALCMILSLILPLTQSRNPYMEALAQINKTAQLEVGHD